MAGCDVHSKIVYFSQYETFKAEKPYTTAFSVADRPGAIPTNHEFDIRNMVIYNVRRHGHLDINTAGFQFMRYNTSLTREDFDSNNIVEDRYCTKINNFVQKILPQYSAIAFLEYEVCDPALALCGILHITAVGRSISGASISRMLQVLRPHMLNP